MSGVRYANGRVPLSLLVHLGGRIYLAPGVAAAWAYLCQLALDKYGVTLRITPQLSSWDGWNGYRPYDAQVTYRAHLGAQAAIAGTSPHGWLHGIDVWNWRDLAPTNEALAWARFVTLCTLAAFATLRIRSERWHIEYTADPWTVPAYAGVVINPETTNRPKEEDMMKDAYIWWEVEGRTFNAIVNTSSGYFQAFESGDGGYNTRKAQAFNVAASAKVTASDADSIERACARVRAGEV